MKPEGKYYLEVIRERPLHLNELCSHIRALLHYTEEEDPPFSQRELIDCFSYSEPIEGSLRDQLKVLFSWFEYHVGQT